ncbi:MAG: hypothetical protein K2N20_03230 [Helicobacter sp.]|nr:hypothetical protein [Helicobacter sp.]
MNARYVGILCSLIAALAPLARNDIRIVYLLLLTDSNNPSHSAQRLCSSRKA